MGSSASFEATMSQIHLRLGHVVVVVADRVHTTLCRTDSEVIRERCLIVNFN